MWVVFASKNALRTTGGVCRAMSPVPVIGAPLTVLKGSKGPVNAIVQSVNVPEPKKAVDPTDTVNEPVALSYAVIVAYISVVGALVRAMLTGWPTTHALPVWVVNVFEPAPTNVLVALVPLVPGALTALVALFAEAVALALALLACVVASVTCAAPLFVAAVALFAEAVALFAAFVPLVAASVALSRTLVKASRN